MTLNYGFRNSIVMLRETSTNRTHSGSRVKFAGICADAQRLGVSRVHLWLVLTGARQSRVLRQRYLALKRSGGRATRGGAK